MYLVIFRLISPLILRYISRYVDAYLAERHERRLIEKAAQRQAHLNPPKPESTPTTGAVLSDKASLSQSNASWLDPLKADTLAYTASALLLGSAVGLILVLLFKREE